MCGRYTATDPEMILAELLDLGIDEIDLELSPRYNVAPSQVAAVVACDGPRRLVPAAWGLIPTWARRQTGGRPFKPLINARSETAAHKPSFRDAVKRRRCLVIADGYYEWQREGRRKTPHYIRARGVRALTFAGLWAPGDDDDPVRTFAILTTAADELIAPIHDRMPIILGAEARARWLASGDLSPAQAEAILHSADSPAMQAHPVTSAVGSPSFDEPACIESVARQPSLFDRLG
jgi:putative SOS response-associated peptidase YedK